MSVKRTPLQGILHYHRILDQCDSALLILKKYPRSEDIFNNFNVREVEMLEGLRLLQQKLTSLPRTLGPLSAHLQGVGADLPPSESSAAVAKLSQRQLAEILPSPKDKCPDCGHLWQEHEQIGCMFEPAADTVCPCQRPSQKAMDASPRGK